MNSLYLLPEEQILLFAVLFLRVVGFIVAMPVIGTPSVPVSVKVLFSLTFSVLMFPVVLQSNLDFSVFSEAMIWVSLKEIMVGLFLGFLVRMFFFSMSVAGELAGVTSGMGAAQIFNPSVGDNATAIETFHVLIGTVIFLILGGHHLFLSGFAASFDFMPVTSMGFNVPSAATITQLGREGIATGIRLAAPVWVAMVIANMAMGLLGRAVPQINIFVMNFHVTIMMALGIMMVMLPFFVSEMGDVIETMAIGFGEAVKSL